MTYTADLSDTFFTRVRDAASLLACDPLHLLGVWMSESGCSARALNPAGYAAGVFQAMPQTLAGLGYHPELAPRARAHAFCSLDAADQVPWSAKYYRPYTGHLVSPAACYVATYLPAYVREAADPAFVLASTTVRPWAYTPNRGLDVDGDGAITVHDLADRIASVCRGPRWTEIASRAQGGPLPTIADVQRALTACGYAPGDADGVAGPRTTAAIRLFQTDAGLPVDGIAGPATRAALAEAVPDDAA